MLVLALLGSRDAAKPIHATFVRQDRTLGLEADEDGREPGRS